MAEFAYLAIAPSGKEQRGHIAAETIAAARAELDRRRLFVMRIDSETRRAAAPALFSLERKKLSAKELTLFTRQASTLIQVSPIEEALRTIARQSEKPHVRKVIDRVHAGIIEGRRLAEAMGGEPRSFPLLYRAMVSAGESSGSLPLLMERLADLLRSEERRVGEEVVSTCRSRCAPYH